MNRKSSDYERLLYQLSLAVTCTAVLLLMLYLVAQLSGGWPIGPWLAAIGLPAILGYILDRRLGDPYSYHPIVGFGRLIAWGEHRLNRGRYRRAKGVGFHLVLILGMMLASALPYVVFFYLSYAFPYTYILVVLALLWILYPAVVFFYMISGTTLCREVQMVFAATDRSVEEGRCQVARIVGRDTTHLSAQEIRLAALETLSENLSDGIVAPVFWWALLGVPGIVGYKMINTQDSMVGYLNERYREYGWFSAKLDDLVNYIPARLTALLMLSSTSRPDLLSFVWRYGRSHLSPNSGYPEAALAGILGCRFGGPHDYFGQEVYKPYIGEVDRPITTQDMHRAIHINRRVEVYSLLFALLLRLILLLLVLDIFR